MLMTQQYNVFKGLTFKTTQISQIPNYEISQIHNILICTIHHAFKPGIQP